LKAYQVVDEGRSGWRNQRADGAEAEHFAHMLTAPEAKEAFTAFFEKRKPDFSRFN
jgi:1,4-dihydroxy-2-naphthoyl-CoA synthase